MADATVQTVYVFVFGKATDTKMPKRSNFHEYLTSLTQADSTLIVSLGVKGNNVFFTCKPAAAHLPKCL